jgi:MoxR-like ATPase
VTEKSNLFHIWQNRIAGIKKPDMSDIGITVEEVLAAREAIDEVDVSDAMLEMMFLIVNEFRLDGLDISVRKQNLALDIVRAEAILNGRVNVEAEDFAVLQHVLWNDPDDAHKVRQIILRVANPMMDEIHTGIDAAKKALDEARSQIKNGAGEEQRIRVGSQARHEISAILKGLKQMSTTVNTDTKTGKEIRRAHNRVTRYQKSLMSEVFDLDVDALTQLVEENV